MQFLVIIYRFCIAKMLSNWRELIGYDNVYFAYLKKFVTVICRTISA